MIEGFVENIIYKNNDNAYCVLEVSSKGDAYILVGTFPYVAEGDYIQAEGEMVLHPVYGEQMKVRSFSIKPPQDLAGIEKYLASGAIKGIGEGLSRRIIKKFGEDTMRIMEEEPERLAEVKGISERMAMEISAQVEGKRDMREALVFLSKYGISMNVGLKIYRFYGSAVYGIIQNNPYQLADDLTGIGFKIADEIARRVGFSADSEYRIKSAIVYCLGRAQSDGHMYLPEDELYAAVREVLGLSAVRTDTVCDAEGDRTGMIPGDAGNIGSGERGPLSAGSGRSVPDSIGAGDYCPQDPRAFSTGTGTPVQGSLGCGISPDNSSHSPDCIAADGYHSADGAISSMSTGCPVSGSTAQFRALLTELGIEKKIIVRDEKVYAATAYYTELDIGRLLHIINGAEPIEIITGGPGTGKTTNIKRLIDKYEKAHLEVACCAPTGRAAKRMEEATGHEACTIHRLLEVSGRPEEGDSLGPEDNAARFARNEEYPLEYDVVIVDEMSMVDAYLMRSLLKAIAPGTRLILVGDTNQLPSVGPGNVLKDIIASGCFDTLRLSKIYRQDEQSDIIINAHRMIDGEPVDLSRPSRDFVFVKRQEPDQIIAAMITLIRDKLPAYVDADIGEIQIMSPMKKGSLGVERLNVILQQYLNPAARGKTEKEIGGTIWREGDKVMQIKNNYRLEWEVRDSTGCPVRRGEGVYNGDIGIICEINTFAEEISVRFDDDRIAVYSYSDTEQLELAYAITIHKSQGSEYPAVIIPVHSGPRMLMTRNLIYTAVTRARKCVTLVGVPECFAGMAANTHEQNRYSSLRERLLEFE